MANVTDLNFADKSKHQAIYETQSSTSSTTESAQIEDVEILNAEDEDGTPSDKSVIEDFGDDDEKQTVLGSSKKDWNEKVEEREFELANSLSELSEEQKDEIFTEKQQHHAICNLILCSVMLFTIPVILMYISYKFVFKDIFKMSIADATLYGGIVGVVAVYFIIFGFVWLAYCEEKDLEQRYKTVKSK